MRKDPRGAAVNFVFFALAVSLMAFGPLYTPPVESAVVSDVVQIARLADVVERVTPSVVHVQVGTAGVCSGVVVDAKKRHVVTAKHCIIEGQTEFKLTFSNGKQVDAKLVGVHEKIDIAVLRIVDDMPLAEAMMGNAKSLRVGDPVFAIGHPFKFKFTVTAGIISFIDRDDGDASGKHLQTDTPVNPGNSGGPLFDFAGRLIGINDQIFTMQGVFGPGGNLGIAFAIPVHTMLAAVAEITA